MSVYFRRLQRQARLDLEKIRAQFQLNDTQIQFLKEPFNPSAGLLVQQVEVAVTDSNGIVATFTNYKTVQVDITGGTAAGAQVRQGGVLSPVNGSLAVSMVDGLGLCDVIATGTGTVQLFLTDVDGSGLDVTDTATVTFS